MILSCNPHGKRLATLLPNYWLAETPQAERDFKTKLIGTGVRDSGGKSASKGYPTGANAEGGPPAGKRVPRVEINVYKRKKVDL